MEIKRDGVFTMDNHFHGVGTQIAPNATAFGMRHDHFMVDIIAGWEPESQDDPAVHRRWASDLSADLAPLALPGGYANFLAPDAHDQIGAAYGNNAGRLRELKRRFDPDNVFSSAIPLPV